MKDPQKPQREKPSDSEICRVMSEMGRRGGAIGGKRRAERMTAEQRSNIASIAARHRWGKKVAEAQKQQHAADFRFGLKALREQLSTYIRHYRTVLHAEQAKLERAEAAIIAIQEMLDADPDVGSPGT